jgi:hypothetical protein
MAMHIHFNELYEVIKRLMNATFEATDTEMKVRLAHLLVQGTALSKDDSGQAGH